MNKKPLKSNNSEENKDLPSLPMENPENIGSGVSMVNDGELPLKNTPFIDDKEVINHNSPPLTKSNSPPLTTINHSPSLTNIQIVKTKEIMNYFKYSQNEQRQLEYAGYLFLHQNKAEFSIKEASDLLDVPYSKLVAHISRFIKDKIYLQESQKETKGNVKLLELTDKGIKDVKAIIEGFYRAKQIKKEDLLIRLEENGNSDVTTQIGQFKEFIEKNYLSKLMENVRNDRKVLVMDFHKLSEFDPELADLLLEQPDDTIKACELAIEQFDIENCECTKARFNYIPKTQIIRLRDIRSKHLLKFYHIEGVVRQKSDIRPQVTSAKFECPSCGNILNVLQLVTTFKEPSRCGCGRKGKFHLVSKELIDAQGLVLEEESYDLEAGEQPKRLNVFLSDDLVSPISDKRTSVGIKVKVIGIIKEVPIILKTGAKSTRLDLLIEANYLEPIEEDFASLEIKKEDIDKIIKLSKRKDIFDLLTKSLIPSIQGHDKIKEGLLLQQMGGVRKEVRGGVIRGDIHIILISDPASGKSQMLKRIHKISPKAIYVSGTGLSDVGITASVVKDEFLKGWSLEAGAMVLANNGIMCFDEMDKAKKEYLNSLHVPMEQQIVPINKANIQAVLKSQTSVLCALNPEFGRFDPYGNIAEQINLPSTLINRFDLIYTMKDLPDEKKDGELVDFILDLHDGTTKKEDEIIEDDLLRKYISHARKNCKPKLTKKAKEKIKKFYIELRSSNQQELIKNIPLNPRQIDGLVRLAEASAKIRLSKEITEEDSKRAIDLLTYTLKEVGLDPQTGKIDIDRIATGFSGSDRDSFSKVKKSIDELEKELGKTIPIEDIVKRAEGYGISEEKTEECLEKLKTAGDIFYPRTGFVQKI